MGKIAAFLMLLAFLIPTAASVGAEQHTGVSYDVRITHTRPLYSQVLVLVLGKDGATQVIKWKMGVEDWITDLIHGEDDHPKWAS